MRDHRAIQLTGGQLDSKLVTALSPVIGYDRASEIAHPEQEAVRVRQQP